MKDPGNEVGNFAHHSTRCDGIYLLPTTPILWREERSIALCDVVKMVVKEINVKGTAHRWLSWLSTGLSCGKS